MFRRPGVPIILVASALMLTACTTEELDEALNGVGTARDAGKSFDRVVYAGPDLDFAPDSDGRVRYCRRPGCTSIYFWDRYDLGTTTGVGNVQALVYLSGDSFESDQAVQSLSSINRADRVAEITVTFDFPTPLPLLADIQGISTETCGGDTGVSTAPEVPGVVVGHIRDLEVTYTATATIYDHDSGPARNGVNSHNVDRPDAPDVSFSVAHEDNHFLCDLATVLSAADETEIEAGLRDVFDDVSLRDRIASDLNGELARHIESELQLSGSQTYRAHVFIDDEVVVSYVW